MNEIIVLLILLIYLMFATPLAILVVTNELLSSTDFLDSCKELVWDYSKVNFLACDRNGQLFGIMSEDLNKHMSPDQICAVHDAKVRPNKYIEIKMVCSEGL